MSAENNSTPKSKVSMIVMVAGILALAAGGTVVMAQKSEAETGVEKIAPAAGEKDAAPEMIGDVKMGDPVVAKMGGKEIKRSDVLGFITTLPEQVRQMPLQTLFPLALEQVLNNEIVGKKAADAKLESDPEVTKILEEAKVQVIRNVYIERELNKAVSQKELQKSYDKLLTSIEKVEEVRARHILVADEAKAREIIKKLDEGTKFEDLAKESTDGPTAANGGDLGYFAKSEMVPEFATAAFAIAPGSYTKDPIKTQFGWHVIKVEDKRQRPEPQFEAVKPQLEAQVRREKLASLLEGWQKEAKIQKFDINGDPIKAETPKKK